MKNSVEWWKNQLCLCGCPFHLPSSNSSYNTSLFRWEHASVPSKLRADDHLWKQVSVSISWNSRQSGNFCLHLLPIVNGKSIRIQMDNVACMFYTNKQGGAISPFLCSETLKLWNCHIAHQTHISYIYLLEFRMSQPICSAGAFPRTCNGIWWLKFFMRYFKGGKFAQVDLITTFSNKKYPLHCSIEASVVNDLSYAFPMHTLQYH